MSNQDLDTTVISEVSETEVPMHNGITYEKRSLVEIVQFVRQLAFTDKITLLRILAQDIDAGKDEFSFERGVVYEVPSFYDAYEAAERVEAMLKTQEIVDK